MRRILSLLLCALCAYSTVAQAPGRYIFSVRHYGTVEGLPKRNINAIAQDHQGFIWLATPMGLTRFDGYTFVNHTRANGLSADAVEIVVCDGDGLLWMLHPDGRVDIMDPRTGVCSTLQQHFAGRSPAPPDTPVLGLDASDNGIVAFYQEGCMMRYRNATEGLMKMPLTYPVPPLPRRVEINGDVWCFCEGTRSALTAELVRLGTSATDAITRIPDVERIGFMGRDLWTGGSNTAHGLYLWRGSGQAWLLPDGTHTELKDVADTTVVRSIWNGMVRFQLADDIWLVNTTIRRMRAGDDPFKAPVLFDIAAHHPEARHFMHDALRDRAGNVWACGAFGLFKLTMAEDHMQRWLWDSTVVNDVGTNVRGMALISGRLHVNTEYTGHWVLDAATGAVLSSHANKTYDLGLLPDGNGGAWRSVDNFIVRTDATGMETQRHELPRYVQGAWSILRLGPEQLLVGTIHGLARLNGSRPAERIFHRDHPELNEAAVWHLQRDRAGRILASTDRGIYRLNDEGSVLEHWSIDATPVNGIPHTLPTDDIRHFHEDSIGLFWLATATNGLVRWNKNTGHTRVVGMREGLPATSIHAVYPDAFGSLWLPTDNGLVRYDPRTGQVKVFTVADGITNNEFNRLAHAQGADGRLYFGGFNGITVVDPAELRTNSNAPAAKLLLESVQQQEADRTGLTDRTLAVLDGAPIIVQPGDRSFTVDMALLSYDDPAQIRYAWRIEGIDEGWNRQAEPHLRFNALPYGEHDLHITAVDANGRSSANELVIPIIVLRPVYLRWWFIALCLLAVSAAVYALVRYRLSQLQRVLRVRDRIAMDLHDEVGSNLSGIVLFSAAVKNNVDGLSPKVTGMLESISDNSTRAMESMNDIVWSANPAHDRLADVVDRMRAYAEPLCEAADIELTFNLHEVSMQSKLGMEKRKSLYLIFKEAVNNAVKHAHCTRITVTLGLIDQRVQLTVADNGTGMTGNGRRDASLGGNGLDNMRRRAADVGGTLHHHAGNDGGTEVVLRMDADGA